MQMPVNKNSGCIVKILRINLPQTVLMHFNFTGIKFVHLLANGGVQVQQFDTCMQPFDVIEQHTFGGFGVQCVAGSGGVGCEG